MVFQFMTKKKDSVSLGLTIDRELFGRIEKARMTERGRIPRNSFITAAIEQVLETPERNGGDS